MRDKIEFHGTSWNCKGITVNNKKIKYKEGFVLGYGRYKEEVKIYQNYTGTIYIVFSNKEVKTVTQVIKEYENKLKKFLVKSERERIESYLYKFKVIKNNYINN